MRIRIIVRVLGLLLATVVSVSPAYAQSPTSTDVDINGLPFSPLMMQAKTSITFLWGYAISRAEVWFDGLSTTGVTCSQSTLVSGRA